METGETVRAETTLTGEDRVHIRDLTLKPLQDASGSIVGITGTALDVTERAVWKRHSGHGPTT